ncbi:MAG: site-2 protease family protein, partial [Candidatus Cloacimonetes bacterium]|nr:site-2 protease family protein [Candidatus Cloacimonadota bacterium]
FIMNQFFILVFPILYALTVHEFSHGYIAYRLGDDTAKRAGRLTLNPLKHLDPLGTIMLFIVHIGWARPVPINPYNFKDVKRDTAYVALAGPAANFISAIIFSLIFDIKTDSYLIFHDVFKQIIFYTIFINIAFGLFNLIPFPPLDGSRIIGAFLSDEAYFKYQQFERKGVFILIGIILIGNMMGLNIIGGLIIPPINFFLKLLIGVQI